MTKLASPAHTFDAWRVGRGTPAYVGIGVPCLEIKRAYKPNFGPLGKLPES